MPEYIALGMYASWPGVQQAWRVLFNTVRLHYPDSHFPENIVFNSDRESILNKSSRISHTCGYPLMTKYREWLRPLCVPCFDAEGCDGTQYSSHFLVRQDSEIYQLADSRDHVAVINGSDSNSGMNVFRAAISEIHFDQPHVPFFKAVITSGSHLWSIEALRSGEADIAAIDAVTFAFEKLNNPGVGRDLRSIGFSEKTTGLPFVTHINEPFSSSNQITDILNSVLKKIDSDVKQALMIDRFEAVGFQDYQSIMDIEQQAIDNGYPIIV